MNKPKRSGRPALDEDDPSVKVSISLPSKQFDDYCRRAQQEDLSVPEVIRRELAAKKITKNP